MRAPFLICVGNAIVDILVKVEDSFLNSNDLIKGSMSLVNNEEFDNIFSKISEYKIESGGSAANTAVGYSYFGGNSIFYAACISQTIIFGIYFNLDIGYLWLNFIGAVNTMILSTVFNHTLFRKPINQ